jgi:hypothetical protein
VFSATGNLTVARSGHLATLLADAALPRAGQVLIVGGDSGGTSAELYDPHAGTFAATGPMTTTHAGGTATLLKSGRVLIAGGGSASAELFDPASGTFAATGSMTLVRSGHTATRLANGQVLIAGGDPNGAVSAELYDPASGTFSATGNLVYGRVGATAVLLTDGTVLVFGPAATAELYDPVAAVFTEVGTLATNASGAVVALRNDGTVLVAGGTVQRAIYVRNCPPYYPVTGRCGWRIVGYRPVSITTSQLYAPEAQGFLSAGNLLFARDSATATVLNDGSVLVVAGWQHTVTGGTFPTAGSAVTLGSAEIYK